MKKSSGGRKAPVNKMANAVHLRGSRLYLASWDCINFLSLSRSETANTVAKLVNSELNGSKLKSVEWP